MTITSGIVLGDERVWMWFSYQLFALSGHDRYHAHVRIVLFYFSGINSTMRINIFPQVTYGLQNFSPEKTMLVSYGETAVKDFHKIDRCQTKTLFFRHSIYRDSIQ